MQKLKNIHVAFLTLLITGLSASVSAQTPTDYSDLTKDLPSLSTTGLDPAMVEEATSLLTAPQGTCNVVSGMRSVSGPEGSGRWLESNLKLRVLLMINLLDNNVDAVNVKCALFKPGQSYPKYPTDGTNHSALFDSNMQPKAWGSAHCESKNLTATSVDIPILLPEGDLESEYDRYRCVMYFKSVHDTGKYYELPEDSVDTPDWRRARNGTELVNQISGYLTQ